METFFQPPSMSLDLSLLLHQFRQAEFLGTVILPGTQPGTPFLCLSSVSSHFWSPFLSPAIAPWSVSLSCRVGCLILGERSGGFVNKVFGLLRVCVGRLVKVSGSDKLLKLVRVRSISQYKEFKQSILVR